MIRKQGGWIMDENQDQAENQAVEETTTVAESPAAEEQTQQTESENQGVEVEQQPDSQDESTGNRAKNAQSRIKELLKEREEKDRQLKAFLSTPQPSPRDSGNFADRFAGRDEVLPDDLNRAAEEYAAQKATDIVRNEIDIVKSELRQEQLRAQVKEVQSAYSELNPDSDNYDPALDAKIAEMYTKYGSGVPLTDYVAEQMELASATASRAAAEAGAAVVRQKEESALTPGTQSKSEKPAQEKSISELEAELGFAE
jgi:hypothetical protein